MAGAAPHQGPPEGRESDPRTGQAAQLPGPGPGGDGEGFRAQGAAVRAQLEPGSGGAQREQGATEAQVHACGPGTLCAGVQQACDVDDAISGNGQMLGGLEAGQGDALAAVDQDAVAPGFGFEGFQRTMFGADEEAPAGHHQAGLGQPPTSFHRQGGVLVPAGEGAGHGGVVAAGVGSGLVLALQQDDALLSGAGQVESEAESRDAAADDRNLCRVNRAHESILAPNIRGFPSQGPL